MSAQRPEPALAWVSDRHLRLQLGDDTSLRTHQRVREAFDAIRRAVINDVQDITPAYATLLIAFDIATLDPDRAEAEIRSAITRASPPDQRTASDTRLVEIPVCYEPEFAPDLDAVARLHDLSREEVVSLHSGGDYFVHFIGFSPGFPYLGGLPKQLATPRLDQPRTRVPAGSVGLAGDQTGIYPHATAGGWRLIGRTPLTLFDAQRDPPALLQMGDRVRFVPIDAVRFQAIASGTTNRTDQSRARKEADGSEPHSDERSS